MTTTGGDAARRGADAATQHDTASTLRGVAARAEAQMQAENFPVALRFLPSGPRGELSAVYRFARFVDDVGDETDTDAAGRLRLLDAVDRDVRRLAGPSGERPELAPVAGLESTVRAHDVPVRLLHDLVEANRRDQSVRRYPDFAALLDYCAYSANPVGRLVLHIADAADPANVTDSDAVCSALQVLEHCQDVGEDAARDRVYLPADDLDAAGVPEAERIAQLTGSVTSPALRRAVQLQVARSRELLEAGPPLVARLSGWSRVAVAGYVAGGLATADALQAADYAVLDQAVRPGKARTAWHAVRLLAGRGRSDRAGRAASAGRAAAGRPGSAGRPGRETMPR